VYALYVNEIKTISSRDDLRRALTNRYTIDGVLGSIRSEYDSVQAVSVYGRDGSMIATTDELLVDVDQALPTSVLSETNADLYDISYDEYGVLRVSLAAPIYSGGEIVAFAQTVSDAKRFI